jgi:hypothetical protein
MVITSSIRLFKVCCLHAMSKYSILHTSSLALDLSNSKLHGIFLERDANYECMRITHNLKVSKVYYMHEDCVPSIHPSIHPFPYVVLTFNSCFVDCCKLATVVAVVAFPVAVVEVVIVVVFLSLLLLLFE